MREQAQPRRRRDEITEAQRSGHRVRREDADHDADRREHQRQEREDVVEELAAARRELGVDLDDLFADLGEQIIDRERVAHALVEAIVALLVGDVAKVVGGDEAEEAHAHLGEVRAIDAVAHVGTLGREREQTQPLMLDEQPLVDVAVADHVRGVVQEV